VLVNAVFLGLEFTYLETAGGFSLPVFLLNAAYIAAGQAVACIGLGLPLAYVLERTGVANKLAVTD
jgi:ABC-type Fe3+ transport system permease subunit